MECHYLLFLIEIRDLHRDSGRNCKRLWEQKFEGSWEKYLSLIEFAYNNSFQTSIKMAPYEALYGCKCRTPLYWTELSEKKIHGVELIREAEEKVKTIRDSLKAASDR
ncbi:taxadiene 5-alpha hydroxylase [Gossypium australe]|uniref:Taxadiene 5-alpha hydroxylase n=1 Tax=Gossypium australe TaxID=47621 RepID=A0A5B6UV23_9ROSI|nr:taxadiene 5-alpha hydroxylase [Gossypium australe]